MAINLLSPIAPLAQVDLLAQTAAVSATTIFTPAVSGRYAIYLTLKITTVAGTSSGLGPVTIAFTDPDDSVAQSQICGLMMQTGAFSASANAINTTAGKLTGVIIVNAKAGVAITWAIAYSSSPANIMTYSAHAIVRAA
jgi:hypothetical protein